jgi:hypothetical protein
VPYTKNISYNEEVTSDTCDIQCDRIIISGVPSLLFINSCINLHTCFACTVCCLIAELAALERTIEEKERQLERQASPAHEKAKAAAAAAEARLTEVRLYKYTLQVYTI